MQETVPVKVEASETYIIRLCFSDGTGGELDLRHLSGKGVFRARDENDLFREVHINPETDSIAWNDELELCPDFLYLKLQEQITELV